jgi:hypothetical protein
MAHVSECRGLGTTQVDHPGLMAATVTDANTCLRWLDRDQPDLEEARAAAARVVKDAIRR